MITATMSVVTVCEYIIDQFPYTADDKYKSAWPKDQWERLRRDLGTIDISTEQAKAAIGQLRWNHGKSNIEPKAVIDALRAVADPMPELSRSESKHDEWSQHCGRVEGERKWARGVLSGKSEDEIIAAREKVIHNLPINATSSEESGMVGRRLMASVADVWIAEQFTANPYKER